MEDKRKNLYDTLVADGYDLGDYNSFSKNVNDSSKRRNLYDAVAEEYDLGDYHSFESKLGLNIESPVSVDGTVSVNPEIVGMSSIALNPDRTHKEKEFSPNRKADDSDGGIPEYLKRPTDSPDVIKGFIPALKQGSDALYQGVKSSVGETANLLNGSQRDYTKAQEQLQELVDSGYDLSKFNKDKALKDYKDRQYERDMTSWEEMMQQRRGERENMGFFDALVHKFKDPDRPRDQYDSSVVAFNNKKAGDEVQLGRAFDAIQEVLTQSNGDVEKAYALLGEQSTKETWGDKTSREVREAMREFKPTEGAAAWVGNMIPQMAGNVAAIAASASPWTRWMTRPLGAVNMGMLTASSSGSTMAEAREYAGQAGVNVSEGDVLRAGTISGAIEAGTEMLPYERFFGGIHNFTANKLGKEVANAIVGNQAARSELSDIIKQAAKDLPAKVFTKEAGKKLIGDVSVEGFSEFLAEGGGTLVPMIYQNPEDYPTLYEVLENGWEGAKGGIFMGSILGGASSTVGHYQNRARRKQQGKIMLADTQDGVLEVLGHVDGDKYVAVDGDGVPREITRDMVNDFQVIPFGEFDKYCREQTDENLQKAVDSGRALATEDADRREKRAAKFELDEAEQILSEEQKEELDIRPIEYLSEHENEANILIPYLNAKSKFDGMIMGIRDGIDEKVSTSNQHITNLTHQDGNVYDVTLNIDENKHVFPVSGSIVADENGIIDKKQSDSRFIVRDDQGRIEMRSVDDLYKLESTENAETIKSITAQSIREQESARHAEEIDTPSEEERALKPGGAFELDDIGIDDYIGANELSEFGEQRAYENEEASIEKAKQQAMMSLSYRNGEIGAREMLVNDIYRYGEEVSDERLKEQAEGLSEYWAKRYPGQIKVSDSEREFQNIKNGTEKEGEVRENTGAIQKEGEESDIVPAAVEAETLPEVELRPDTKVESENAGSSIPVDEKGNLLYHRTPVDVTLDNVRSYGLDEAETDEFVSAQKVDASKRLEKLQKGKPKVGTNLAKYQSEKKAWEDNLMDVQAQVDYWNEVDAQIQATRIQPGDMTAEAINSMGDPMNGEELAAMMLGTRKLPLLFDDYKRETGFSSQDAKRMLGLFAEKVNGGMSIEQAGEKLMEMDAANGTGFFDQTDANAGRNAVLEVLSSSRTRGGLFGYIKGNRERMAEQERQAEYSAYEQWVNNVKHMSVAEYEADEETIESRMKEISESFNFDEINGDIADDLIKEENDRRTKESGVEPITGGSAENIQGEFDGSTESGGVGRPEIPGVIGESQEWREGSADENGISGADVVGTQQSGERIGESLFDYAQRIDDSRKIAQAEKIVDTEPTEAQKDAGNYKMGHVKIGGHDVTIENPKGSVRRGVGADGKAWETPMNNTYGYFRGTKGKDGDHVDVFLGANLKPESVYVVDQMNEDGSFDEHKVMYGFDSVEDAREAYLSNYEDGWQGLGEITGVPGEVFDEWLGSGMKKQKPFAEYKKVQQVVSEEKQDIVASVQAEAISFVTGRNMDEVKDELIGKSSDGIRFRLVEDDVFEFVAKHNLDEAEVRKYAESMRLGNLGGASCAFHEIRRKVRIDNTTDSLQQFAHRFAPIKKELYEAFGSVDELREEAIHSTMMERNTMEAARKRVETEEETERIRLQEFQDMSDSQLDSEYFKAIGENNESRMRDLVNEAARRSGYMYGAAFRMAHGAPTYDEAGIDKSLVDVANNKDQIRDSLNELLRMNRDEAKDESAAVIDEALTAIDNGENPTVTIYRAVPKSLKEGTVRSGDWVTLSKSYAKLHGEHTLSGDYRIMKDEVPAENLYWDGNDINEWGYDDRSDYRYKNTKNNRKLNDLITRDDKGSIIPLSNRFNSRKEDVRYRIPAVLLEKGERIEKLRNSQPVEITGEEIVPSNNLKEYKKNALEYGKSLRGEYENRDTGAKISLGKSGVKEVLNHDFKDIAQLQSVAAIPQIIENSIYIDAIENLDVEKNADVSKYHYYVCGLKIDGIDYTVRAVVAEQPNGERFYDHKLTRIGKGKLIDSLSGITTPGFNQSTPLSEYKDKKLISILQMNSDKSEKEIDDIIFSINKLSEILRTPIKEVHNVSEITDVDSTVEKRKRKAKGWFDTVTGEVVIVLPNAVSAEDAQATILHEVVAHKGLRDMFGKEFDSFLDKVYRDVDEPIRAKITALSRNHGFDTHVATEEYLAGLAERGFEDVEEKSVWDKVKDFFMDMLSKAGIKMLAPLSDADLRYILWRSYENQINGSDIISKAEDAVRDRDIRGGLIKKPISNKETEVRFREDAEDEDAEDAAKREYKKKGRKSRVERLTGEISDLRGRLRSEQQDLESTINAMQAFVTGHLSAEAAKDMSKSDVEDLIREIGRATKKRELEGPMMAIERLINEVMIRKGTRELFELSRMKVQGSNNRGVSVANKVDNGTRQVIEGVRNTFADLITSGMERDIRRLGKEAGAVEREINSIADNERNDGIYDELKDRLDALRKEQDALKEQKDGLLRNRVEETRGLIEGRMSELESKMQDAAEERGVFTKEDGIEYDALPVRLMFVETRELTDGLSGIDRDIAGVMEENRGLRKSHAEENRKSSPDADVLNGVKVRMKANHAKINGLRRERIAMQQSLLEKISEADNALREIIETGKSNLQLFNRNLAERKMKLAGMAIGAVKDKRIKGVNEAKGRLERLGESVEDSMQLWKSPFKAPLYNFNFILKHLDRHNFTGDGELYRHFMKSDDGVHAAGDRYYQNWKSHSTELEQHMKEVFGKDADVVMKEQGKVHNHSGIYITMMYDSNTYGRAGMKRELAMSKGQALYAWMVWQMEDGRAKLEAQGYDEDSMDEVGVFIGPEYVAFAKWVQDEFYPSLRKERYNGTHERLFGTSMAKRNHYFPLKYTTESGQEKQELGEQVGGMPSLVTGNIINRVRNSRDVDTGQSAFELMYEYGKNMEEWNAYAEVRRDLNGLVTNRYLRNLMEANEKGLHREFRIACEVATRSFREDDKTGRINSFLTKANKGLAGGAIAGRLNTALKQLLSAPAFLDFSSNSKFVAMLIANSFGVGLDRKGGRKKMVLNYQWCMENLPSFAERIDSGHMGNEKLDDKGFADWIDKYIEMGMVPNKFVDAFTCSVGAKSVYDFARGRYLKAGLSESEAENKAKFDAAIAFNETQQSGRPEYMAAIQSSSHALWKSLTNFQNSNFGFYRKTAESFHDLTLEMQPQVDRIKEELMATGENGRKAERKAWMRVWGKKLDAVKRFVLFGEIMQVSWALGSIGLMGWNGGGDDDDEYYDDEEKNSIIVAALFGPIMGTLGLGQFASTVASGNDYQPMMLWGQLSKSWDGLSRAYNERGFFSKPMVYEICKQAMNTTGIRYETIENMVLGTEGIVRDGDWSMLDTMFLLNTPDSQRKKVTSRMFQERGLMEYASEVARASKYLSKDGYWWVPGRKSPTEQRMNSIYSEWGKWQLSPEDRMKYEKDLDKKRRANKIESNPDYSYQEKQEQIRSILQE